MPKRPISSSEEEDLLTFLQLSSDPLPPRLLALRNRLAEESRDSSALSAASPSPSQVSSPNYLDRRTTPASHPSPAVEGASEEFFQDFEGDPGVSVSSDGESLGRPPSRASSGYFGDDDDEGDEEDGEIFPLCRKERAEGYGSDEGDSISQGKLDEVEELILELLEESGLDFKLAQVSCL